MSADRRLSVTPSMYVCTRMHLNSTRGVLLVLLDEVRKPKMRNQTVVELRHASALQNTGHYKTARPLSTKVVGVKAARLATRHTTGGLHQDFVMAAAGTLFVISLDSAFLVSV